MQQPGPLRSLVAPFWGYRQASVIVSLDGTSFSRIALGGWAPKPEAEVDIDPYLSESKHLDQSSAKTFAYLNCSWKGGIALTHRGVACFLCHRAPLSYSEDTATVPSFTFILKQSKL